MTKRFKNNLFSFSAAKLVVLLKKGFKLIVHTLINM